MAPGLKWVAVAFFASIFVSNFAHCEEVDEASVEKALKVVPGSKVKLACKTSAIGMDFDPFKTSEGTLQISISFNEDKRANGEPSNDVVGTWGGSVADSNHEASLGSVVADVCKSGCVVRMTFDENFELWAPAAVMPSKLAKDQALTLATLDATTLELKASTFRNKQLSILEKGPCEVVKP